MKILPISAEIVCDLSLGNKILPKIIIIKYNKYKKPYRKKQETIKFFDNFYRKSFQDTVIDKIYMNLFVIFPLNIWMKRKLNLFLKNEH